MLPLVPVTLIRYVPTAVEVVVGIVTVADPDIVMLVGEMLVPLNADGALTVSETVPVKPPTAFTITFEVPVLP